MQLLLFVLFVLHRMFSGIKNGGGYSKNIYKLCLGAFFTIATPITYCVLFNVNLLTYILTIFISLFPVVIVYAFINKLSRLIHTFEFATTYSFPLVVIITQIKLYDVLWVLFVSLMAYPLGNLLMKGFVNISKKRPFIDPVEITDDSTGKTVNFFILQKEYKIKRINNGYLKLKISIITSLVFLATYLILKFS